MYGRRKKKLNTVKGTSDISTNNQSDNTSETSSNKKAARKSSGGCGCGGKRTKRIREE